MIRPPLRLRLDQALVERGLVPTRARARDLVLRGEIEVDGQLARKPALAVEYGAHIVIRAARVDYVSRGALKLEAALGHFALAARDRVALDVGASTGGFTETLLAAGAARVYAVDNGRDQLHPRLRQDARVVSLEGVDARRLDRSLVPEPVTALVADLSFISLAKALPAALALAAPGCWLVALVKPQFEVGAAGVPRDGIVKDPAQRAAAVERVAAWLGAVPHWRILGTIPSPIHGGDGNVEHLIGALREH